jgi:peptidoglycan/xylan/chitin deacetylase (PgdA/CDA1 family)
MPADPFPAAGGLTRRGFLVAAGLAAAGAAGVVAASTAPPADAGPVVARAPGRLPTRAEIVDEFAGRRPRRFGMFLPGMVRHGKERVALTFDACGGPRGSGYDKSIIATLRKHDVPATLFLSSRWIEAHPHVAADLADDPLFELGNHGWLHRPLTVAGQSAYGIRGTSGPGEAYDEIVRGLHAVATLTGRTPRWYRPGTAWADDVGVALAQRLGLRVIAFSINADAGATASTKEVAANLKKARRTDITLGHLNQPHGRTAEGLAKALPRMIRAGRHFGTLSRVLA